MNMQSTRLAAIMAITLAIGSIGIAQQVRAGLGKTAVMMEITNMKTNTTKMVQWEVDRYQFEENFPVQVDDLKVRKIKQIFNTNEFTFTWQLDEYQKIWHHFEVKITAKAPPANPMKVTFVAKGDMMEVETSGENIKAMIYSDKRTYVEGERAKLFINFVDTSDRFVDPKSIATNTNFAQEGGVLEKKKVGSYVYVTPPLQSGDNIVVIEVDDGRYSEGVESVGVAILPTVERGDSAI